ncbi:MAG TPA: SPOR domain-containing protein [Allosphingosinicella sp.]|nr:SPOR domain-containing protein [Allosphingosinicella sp.]
MSDDARRDEDEMELADEDRLPWLEAVEEEEDEGGPSLAKLVAAILVGLVAIGVIVGGIFWLGNREEAGANGDLIAAPEGDYKVEPPDKGGMTVAGEGDTAYAASEGAQPKGNLNVDAVPEAPVTRAPPAPRPAPVAARPAPPPARPAPARPAPAPAPAASGPTIQLGAFSSQAGANGAWTALAGRFRYLAPLSHAVVSTRVGGRTLYRLRASGADAAGVCRRLRAAGEDCSVVS